MNKKKEKKKPRPNSAFVEVQRALESSPRYNKKDGSLTRRVSGTWIYKKG